MFIDTHRQVLTDMFCFLVDAFVSISQHAAEHVYMNSVGHRAADLNTRLSCLCVDIFIYLSILTCWEPVCVHGRGGRPEELIPSQLGCIGYRNPLQQWEIWHPERENSFGESHYQEICN